jgi:hypothetical protein
MYTLKNTLVNTYFELIFLLLFTIKAYLISLNGMVSRDSVWCSNVEM